MIRFETTLNDDGKVVKNIVISAAGRAALSKHAAINKAIQAILSQSRSGDVVGQMSLFFDRITQLIGELDTKDGLIVGSERDRMKSKVKQLVQSFGDLMPIFDQHWGECVVEGVAKDLAELNADLDFLEFGELLSQSKERKKLTDLLYAVKFMFAYDSETPVGSANLSWDKVEEKLVGLKHERDVSKGNLRKEYESLLNEQRRLEQQLGDFTDWWQLLVQSPEKFQEMISRIKIYNSVPGVLIDHSALDRIENLAIGEYAFDAPNSLDGRGMTSSISHQNCVGVFRLSASKVVCIGSLNSRIFSDYIAKENWNLSQEGNSLYFVVKSIPMTGIVG